MQVHVELWQYPQKPFGQPEPKTVQRIRERFDKQFKSYRARRLSKSAKNPDNRTHVVEAPAGDSQFERLLTKFTDEANKNHNVGGWITCEYDPDEVSRARFALCDILGEDADRDTNRRPLNEAVKIVCDKCRQADMATFPDPFVVAPFVSKKRKQDVFRTGAGILIVRSRVRDLIAHAVSDQVEIGDAIIAGDRRKSIPPEEQLFWIRPRYTIGSRIGHYVEEQCNVCRRPTTGRINLFAHMDEEEEEGQVHDLRTRVSRFADQALDLALEEDFAGSIVPGRFGGYLRRVVASGALLNLLRNNKVLGIEKAEPLLSARDERAFESAPCTIGGVVEFGAGRTKGEPASTAEVPGLKGTSWDTKDGFIHFYLTSPELVVSDPMVWSEKGTAEFRVPRFKPGLYRLPLSAIKRTRARNRVEVDSGSMVFVDAEYLTQLQEAFDWSESMNSRGQYKKSYLTKIAKQIGNRFGFCTAPGLDSGYEFDGDGVYTIDVKAIERVGD